MADKLAEYEVLIGDIPHTLLLSADDAERYGELAKKKAAGRPANKAVAEPLNK